MSTSIQHLSTSEQNAIAYLRSPEAIRSRCEHLFELACADQLQHFRCDLSQIDQVADYVIQVTRLQYPDLQIPFHSRWRHFEVGSKSRLTQLDQQFTELSPLEIARAKFDLVIPSVLLDAGAGSSWHYREFLTGQVWQRSEGLAVASFDLFCQGGFSSHPQNRLQTDAAGLQAVTVDSLSEAFQVSVDNPLVGIEGRVALLQRLGQVLGDRPQWFGSDRPRPGYLVDHLLQQTENHQLSAGHVFQAVLEGLGEIWPGRPKFGSVNLGDVWKHSALPDRGLGSQLVPFHKLSQWLTYSVLEPLQDLGLEITDLDKLTGLPEYRNGGLCLDLGLLQDKHAAVRRDRHAPDSEVIVEWRSLTVILLDRIATAIRQKLELDAAALPLVKVLQGGTWTAGRQIAADLRPGGTPPIQIDSDGTVF
jgi:Protein of unknown function (DUF1688)